MKTADEADTDQRLRAAIESSPTGILMVDADGRIVLVNREIETLFGYPRAELLGQTVEMLVPARYRGTHAGHRGGFFADPKQRRMGAGRDLFGLRKDGKEVPIEIGLTPVTTAEGLFVLSSIVDISARKRADARFRIAVESSPNGMVMINRDGRILLVNREVERMFGYTRDELLTLSIDALVPERFRAAHPAYRRTYFADPHSRAMGTGRELFGLRADGSEFPVEIGLSPIESEEGSLVLGSVVDISARKQAETERRSLEQQLQQAQKMDMIGTLAGGIAHEFNNILGAMLGYIELLRDETTDEGALADIRELLHATERGREVVQRILTLSRRQDAVRRPLNLGDSVKDAVRLLSVALPSSIEIDVRVAPGVPPIVGDPTSVHQVVMNLATNSAHAMPAGGVVTIEVGSFYVHDHFKREHPSLSEGHFGSIVVRDTGTGMTPEVRSHALEPFFTTKAPGAGTGLGLSMVDAIMRAHGGIVLLNSELGRGTEARCLFPAAELPAEQQPELTVNLPRGHGQRVLLIDDEPALAAIGERRLRSLGYEAMAFTDPAAALRAFAAEPAAVDCVVTDYSMRQLNGMLLAEKVHALRPAVPILLLTGFLEDLPTERIQAAGIRRVITKPVTTLQLASVLAELMPPRPS